METPIVYVICDKNCKFEGMTKEQIYTAILQAVNNGTIGDIDAGFVTTIKTINGLPLKFFVGEQAAYDELTAEDKENLFAIITNDTTKEGIIQAITNLRSELEGLINNLLSGKFVVKKADRATEAGKAEWLKSFVLNSYEDLLNILEEYSYYGTYAIAINENEIFLPSSAGKLPIWHSGIMVADNDVSLTLTGYDGDIVSAYYDGSVKTWSVQTLKQKPDEASKADSADEAKCLVLPNNVYPYNYPTCGEGLYCITLSNNETLLISIVDEENLAYSTRSATGGYVLWNPTNETFTVESSSASITKTVCIAQYDF